MEKKRLKKLQGRKIMNMSEVYRASDLEPAAVATRLSRISSNVPDSWLKQIKLTLMDFIAEVVSIYGLPLEELIPKLLSTLDTHLEQQQVFDNLEAMAIEPIAYITTDTKRILAIYLPADQYRPRKSEYDSVPKFMTLQMLFDRSEDFKLTGRGRNHAQQATKRSRATD